MSAAWVRRLVPIVAFVLFSAVALVLWNEENDYEHELVLNHTITSAEQLRSRIEGLMNARLGSLELLADRWVEREPADFTEERFLSFAETWVRHYPGFVGINWITPKGVVRWVFPRQTRVVTVGQDVCSDAGSGCRDSLVRAEQTFQPALTPSFKLPQDGDGFAAFFPLIYGGQLQGFLEGVFQVKEIINVALARDVFKHFGVRVMEGKRLIFCCGGDPQQPVDPRAIHVVRNIAFYGKTWQLYLQPLPAFYGNLANGNLLVLIFGLALSLGLALLLYFLLQRMQMYKASRDQALHEVRERKRIEDVLRENEKIRETLLDELAAKNIELESFVYTVSHDLKTPLVTIEGYIGALREDFTGSLPESAEKYFKYMSDAARRMETLINDLLNLSRIGRHTVQKTEFPFDALVAETLEAMRPQIEARGISVEVQPELPVVYGERERLGQVMDNLLANAIKYIGNENPAPHITVGVEEQAGQPVFFVRDNGIGIEEQFFDKIFQIFERLPAAKRNGEGTGMGLTIVKRIIEHHGGRIWLSSTPGSGTTFYFTIMERTGSHPE